MLHIYNNSVFIVVQYYTCATRCITIWLMRARLSTPQNLGLGSSPFSSQPHDEFICMWVGGGGVRNPVQEIPWQRNNFQPTAPSQKVLVTTQTKTTAADTTGIKKTLPYLPNLCSLE